MRDALVRPGEGIGKVRLGMTLTQARRSLGRPFVFERARLFPGLRYLEYRTNDHAWDVGFLGPRGREGLVVVSTQAGSERTKEGVGVGTPVPAVAFKLRAHKPQCARSYPFINYRLHPLQVSRCAIRSETTRGKATTSFVGRETCTTPMIRYQGCPRIRYVVNWVTVESNRLYRYGLSRWDPDTSDPLPPTTRP